MVSNGGCKLRRTAIRFTDQRSDTRIGRAYVIEAGLSTERSALDVSKITCEQFRRYTITDPRDIALWINGYFNDQRKNTVLNTQKLKEPKRLGCGPAMESF